MGFSIRKWSDLDDEKWAPHIFRKPPKYHLNPFETTKNMYFAYELVDQSKQTRIWPDLKREKVADLTGE